MCQRIFPVSGRRGDVDSLAAGINGGDQDARQDARGVQIEAITDQGLVDSRRQVLGDIDNPKERVWTLTCRQGAESAWASAEAEGSLRKSGRHDADEICYWTRRLKPVEKLNDLGAARRRQCRKGRRAQM